MSGMQRIVGSPAYRWNFHACSRCDGPNDLRTFPDRNAALFWLMRFAGDAVVMADLRSLASTSGTAGLPVWRLNDYQVLEHVSWLLIRGLLHVHRVAAPATAFVTASSVSAVAPPPSKGAAPRKAASESSSPVAKPEQEADTFSSQMDAAATAAVLRSAAAQGVPFCEECARAIAARIAA